MIFIVTRKQNLCVHHCSFSFFPGQVLLRTRPTSDPSILVQQVSNDFVFDHFLIPSNRSTYNKNVLGNKIWNYYLYYFSKQICVLMRVEGVRKLVCRSNRWIWPPIKDFFKGKKKKSYIYNIYTILVVWLLFKKKERKKKSFLGCVVVGKKKYNNNNNNNKKRSLSTRNVIKE